MVLALLASAHKALAGPPFVTDDPEPVDLHHWEVYVASVTTTVQDGVTGTLPHVEVNNGLAPDLQVHLIVPVAFNFPTGSGMSLGPGDTELGAKYRFVHESADMPMIGAFPLVELPTGDAARGLGSGHLQAFLPVWLRKSIGPWTTYGGGGYWMNPGAGNRDYWLFGWLLQKDLDKKVTLGGELYYTTPSAVGTRRQLDFNLGGQYNFDDGHHFLFSLGRSIYGDTKLSSYLAYQWTFGPRASDASPPTSARAPVPGASVVR